MVADAIVDSNWLLPHPRSVQEAELHAHLTTISLSLHTDIDDNYEWVAGDSPVWTFKASTTWEVLRPREQVKDWVDVVWFKGSVPKNTPLRCGLPIGTGCQRGRDWLLRDHLLLSCEYSLEVWREMFIRCSSPPTMFTTWSELLSWTRTAGSKELKLLRKVATQTFVFHI